MIIIMIIVQYCAKVVALPNFRARFLAKFCTISSKKFHLETIFRATFRGNIAQYFGRSNEKSLLRKFAEAKLCVATTVNKDLSDSEVVFPIASDHTAERLLRMPE